MVIADAYKGHDNIAFVDWMEIKSSKVCLNSEPDGYFLKAITETNPRNVHRFMWKLRINKKHNNIVFMDSIARSSP